MIRVEPDNKPALAHVNKLFIIGRVRDKSGRGGL